MGVPVPVVVSWPRWRVLLIAVVLPMFACGTSHECEDRPSQVLLQSAFTDLAVDGVASYSLHVPADLDSPGGVEEFLQWTPPDSSTRLVMSDHPCTVEQLRTGRCVTAPIEGQGGAAYGYPSQTPGRSYIIYILNLGPEVESGSIRIRALGGRPDSCAWAFF